MPATHDTSLQAFISGHHREIIDAFSAFATTLLPEGASMTERELQDHCSHLLEAIAVDLSIEQSAQEASEKGKGDGTARRMEASGQLHADGRLQ